MHFQQLNDDQDDRLAELERIDPDRPNFDMPNCHWSLIPDPSGIIKLIKVDITKTPVQVTAAIELMREGNSCRYAVTCHIMGVLLPSMRYAHLTNRSKFITKRTQAEELMRLAERELELEIDEGSDRPSFIAEQAQLLRQKPNARRYSPSTIFHALNLRNSSRAVYECMRDILCMPSSRLLVKLTTSMGLDGRYNDSEYLAKMVNEWDEFEKSEVQLCIDEIVLKQGFDFSEERLTGTADNQNEVGENGDPEAANSLLCFLLVPIKTSRRKAEMLSMIPVKGLKSNELITYTESVIEQAANFGANINVISTDGHQCNRKLFEAFSGTSDIGETSHLSRDGNIHLSFDVTHWLKNLRNNLITRAVTFPRPPLFVEFLPSHRQSTQPEIHRPSGTSPTNASRVSTTTSSTVLVSQAEAPTSAVGQEPIQPLPKLSSKRPVLWDVASTSNPADPRLAAGGESDGWSDDSDYEDLLGPKQSRCVRVHFHSLPKHESMVSKPPPSKALMFTSISCQWFLVVSDQS